MVARRLLLLLAVLMLLSALAAQIAPPPEERASRGSETATPTPTPSSTPPERPDAVELTVDAASPSEDPIRVRVGDTLRLTVEVDDLVSVEIVGTDQIETAEPDSPAIFNLLVERPGPYPIVVLERDEQIAVIETRR